MIKYKLSCLKCSNTFDSWFASSCEFEKLKKRKYLSCHFCNSKKIQKTLMAPNVINTKGKKLKSKYSNKDKHIMKKIIEFQKFVKKNFENVGENFSYKARSLHYSDKKNEKGIYGSATYKEIKELKEEGIDTYMFPWIDKKDN